MSGGCSLRCGSEYNRMALEPPRSYLNLTGDLSLERLLGRAGVMSSFIQVLTPQQCTHPIIPNRPADVLLGLPPCPSRRAHDFCAQLQ